METLTLIFFVLMLLVIAFLFTQTIRRDLKARERLKLERLEVQRLRVAARREPFKARPAATAHAPHALHAPTLQGRAQESHTHTL
jgi:hypothetical protein